MFWTISHNVPRQRGKVGRVRAPDEGMKDTRGKQNARKEKRDKPKQTLIPHGLHPHPRPEIRKRIRKRRSRRMRGTNEKRRYTRCAEEGLWERSRSRRQNRPQKEQAKKKEVR